MRNSQMTLHKWPSMLPRMLFVWTLCPCYTSYIYIYCCFAARLALSQTNRTGATLTIFEMNSGKFCTLITYTSAPIFSNAVVQNSVEWGKQQQMKFLPLLFRICCAFSATITSSLRFAGRRTRRFCGLPEDSLENCSASAARIARALSSFRMARETSSLVSCYQSLWSGCVIRVSRLTRFVAKRFTAYPLCCKAIICRLLVCCKVVEHLAVPSICFIQIPMRISRLYFLERQRWMRLSI